MPSSLQQCVSLFGQEKAWVYKEKLWWICSTILCAYHHRKAAASQTSKVSQEKRGKQREREEGGGEKGKSWSLVARYRRRKRRRRRPVVSLLEEMDHGNGAIFLYIEPSLSSTYHMFFGSTYLKYCLSAMVLFSSGKWVEACPGRLREERRRRQSGNGKREEKKEKKKVHCLLFGKRRRRRRRSPLSHLYVNFLSTAAPAPQLTLTENKKNYFLW